MKKAASPPRSTTSSTTGSTRKRGETNKPQPAESAARLATDTAGSRSSRDPLPDDHSSEDSAKPQAAAVAPHVVLLPVKGRVKRLSRAQQEQYLDLLARGASSLAACERLGVSAVDVQATLERDDVFRERHALAQALLRQNVATALYRSAMKNNVSAQTSFLKNQPPPHGKDRDASAADSSPYEHMSDEEFFAFCRASGISWPSDDQAGTDPPAVAE